MHQTSGRHRSLRSDAHRLRGRGELEVWTVSGDRTRIRAGDSYPIPPGHDAKVVGEQPFVGIEWNSGSFSRIRSVRRPLISQCRPTARGLGLIAWSNLSFR